MTISRVSSASIFNQSVFQLQRQQGEIARTQLELSTGRRIITAQDDPINAGISQAVDRSLAELERWDQNANLVSNRLRLEEEALRNVSDRVQRMRELAIQANNAPQTPETLRGLVLELRELRSGLLQLANSTDGAGRYLFGGSLDGTAPFVANPNGTYSYLGDQTQRQIEIGPDLTVSDTDPGSEIFMRMRTGNGVFTPTQNPANTGTGVLVDSGFSDQSQWDGGTYQIVFNAGTYTVFDATPVAIAGGPYVEGAAIGFRGVEITFRGTPANGDSFTVAPAATQNLFTTVDQLIATVELPETTAAERATRQNAFFNSLQTLAETGDWVVDRRADLGARLNTIDRTAELRSGQNEVLSKTLSEIRDTDFADAISRLTFQLQSLEAAQQSFIKVNDLSLFNFLR